MLICISIHADTDTLCFRPIILKRVNSSELVVQTIIYSVHVVVNIGIKHAFLCINICWC